MAPPKAKGQKMALGDFLQDTSLGSWADEMEDAPMPSGGRSNYGGGDRYGSSRGFGGDSGGGYTDRGYSVREQLPLPTKPPFTVHLGNMSFDATEGDVTDFFAGCDVTSVRIVEDKVERKPKGFGYAEFATLEGIKKALDLSGTQFQGRNIRISVAEAQKDRPDARDFGDWTRKGPLADLPNQRQPSNRGFGGERGPERGFGAGRSFDNVSDAGSERPGRRQYEPTESRVPTSGNWERKGPLTPTLPQNTAPRAFERPSSKDGPRDRRNSPAPAWGEGRSQDGGSRPPRRDFSDRPPPERTPTAAEQDSQWRTKMRPDAPAPAAISPVPSNKELSVPSSPIPAALPTPTSRPKLNLAKRTVSTAEPSPALSATSADPKASPFGAARPIDTAAREKEIEEKMKQKKEADDKAREEKRVADEKAKEERKAAKEAERAAQKDKPANGKAKDKDGEDEAPGAGKKYEILRRGPSEENADAEEGQNADANGTIIDDKETKPKELVRDVSKPNGAEASPATTSETLVEEGWSTVSKPQKGRKNGNPGARAVAS